MHGYWLFTLSGRIFGGLEDLLISERSHACV